MDKNSPDGAAVVTVVKPSDSSSAPGERMRVSLPGREPGKHDALARLRALAQRVAGMAADGTANKVIAR
jgi:hypothetical protein